MHNSTVPTRLPLEGGPVIDVDPTGDHLEVTITCAGRARAGIALTRTEARRLAVALLDAAAPDYGSAPIDELEAHVAAARTAHPAVTPAKAAAAMREAQR